MIEFLKYVGHVAKNADIALKVSAVFKKEGKKKVNTEIVKAIAELRQAEQNFNYADAELVDIAILQLNASKMKVNALVGLKKNGPSAMDP